MPPAREPWSDGDDIYSFLVYSLTIWVFVSFLKVFEKICHVFDAKRNILFFTISESQS